VSAGSPWVATTGELTTSVTPRPVPAGPARAHLAVSRVDPWSAMKLGFLFSVALGIITVVAAGVLWAVLLASGAPDAVNRLVNQVLVANREFDVLAYASLGRVLSLSALLAAVNVVLLTALSTLGAFLYNLAGGLVGGLLVTLREGD